MAEAGAEVLVLLLVMVILDILIAVLRRAALAEQVVTAETGMTLELA
jgi:hypothetical protein